MYVPLGAILNPLKYEKAARERTGGLLSEKV